MALFLFKNATILQTSPHRWGETPNRINDMKTQMTLLVLCLAPLFASHALAHDAGRIGERREAYLKHLAAQRFDKNGDGDLGKRESKAAITHHDKVETKFDRNGNGSLGRRERGAAASSRIKRSGGKRR